MSLIGVISKVQRVEFWLNGLKRLNEELTKLPDLLFLIRYFSGLNYSEMGLMSVIGLIRLIDQYNQCIFKFRLNRFNML